MQRYLDMYQQLKNLSCPFTWEMENAIENQNKLLETKDDRLEMAEDIQDDFPEFIFIYHTMLAYEKTMSNDQQSALQCLNDAKQCFADITQKATSTNVLKVLKHIFDATKCHILKKQGQLSEVTELLQGISDIQKMNNAELAMLNGCQCLAWSLYYVTDNLKAINYAKEAIKLEPGNGKWQFLSGKNERRLRRMHQLYLQLPSEDEASAFKNAYRLSKTVLFGVSLAQLYRESQNYSMATKTYKEVYALRPTSCTVQLQLALGFIRAKERLLAKSCLEYVRARMPDSVIYTHYMGIYEEKCNKNRMAALPYYKRTTEKGNFGGEWQYIKCRKQVERNWNPLPYMLSLLNKYAKDSERVMQEIKIEIGMYYLSMDDVPQACRFLNEAIIIGPKAQRLKKYIPLFGPFDQINLYDVLEKKVQSTLTNAERVGSDTMKIYLNALQLCRDNRDKAE